MRFDLSPAASSRAHELLRGAKLAFLEWSAARHLATPLPRLRIPIVAKDDPGSSSPYALQVVKRRGRIARLAANLECARSRSGFSTMYRRLGVFIRLLSAPSVPDGDWWVDTADAVHAEGPYLGFCSRWQRTILVPDRGFVAKRGYASERRAGLAAPPFEARDPAIVWRGSPTGNGAWFTDAMDPASADLKQRVRLCLLLRDRPQSGPEAVDVRFARGRSVEAAVEQRYRAAGILADFTPQRSWCRRQFAVDIDGYANAFSNFFIRLLYGCCVIRVGSPYGFRQWYHDRLEPGRHYVAAAADLSDIHTVIDWCRRHPAECRTIAREGQRAALAMTYPAEMRRTIETIRAHAPAAPAAAAPRSGG